VATTQTRFEGFPAAGLTFLRDLERNNERAWFMQRKDVYHERVEEPMRALIADVAAGCAAAKIGLAPNPRQPMFRIYRDVRFSKDKSPYKTAATSAFYPDGDKTRPGVLYIHIDPKAPFVASGFYHPERDALVAIRKAIAASDGFAKCVATLAKRGYALDTDDALVRLPREYADSRSSSRRSSTRKRYAVPSSGKRSSPLQRMRRRWSNSAGRCSISPSFEPSQPSTWNPTSSRTLEPA